MFHDGPVKNEPNVQVHLEPKHQGDGEEPRSEVVRPVKWSAVRAIITYTCQFGDLSISPATSQAAYIISGIIDVPLAKLIEIWGLDLGFAIMMFFNALGLILLATCKNITAYAAAQVIYEIGFHGIYYVITVFIAETAEKKYRALVLSLTCVPYIAATFAGPSFAQTFHEHSSFRWAYGVLLIVTFFMCLPVLVTMRLHMRAKNASANSLSPPGSKSIVDYFIHFDVIGVVLLCSGLTLFFLPWTLAAKQEESWKSATVLVMIILGFCLIVAFVAYEAFLSPKSFVPFSFLKDRNILGACLLLFGWSLSNYCWNTYYRIYLQVVNRLSIATAGYVINIYWDGIAVGSVLAGL
ncbi:siderophore iron transporter [Penicillium angulare]|uniref:Siderophore iron transporter n=1 Tax=Penicillium angulare TaxID=116970 RepID=A0A9W9FZL8_9EURO|nr:siderophore iron transporter [Penicillium angulare]